MAARALFAVRRPGPGRLGGVRLAGAITAGAGVSPRRPRHFPDHGLTVVTRGVGRYRDAAHDVPLGPGDAVVVFPGHPHWYGPAPGETWDEVFLVFGGPLVEALQAEGVLDPRRPVLRPGGAGYWRRRVDSFRLRPEPSSGWARDAEACDLARLLIDLTAAASGEISGDSSGDTSAETSGDGSGGRSAERGAGGWREASLRLLADALADPLDLRDVARAVGMPYETWRRRFRDEVGLSPGRYRLRCRIDAAESLLRSTSLSVRDVAAATGFVDEQHLGRHARATLGTSPARYRRSAMGAGPPPPPVEAPRGSRLRPRPPGS